ncbi:tRNA lysidine(34) synthetase TilS [Enterococcus sp. AZ109]|uniref:tRNA lysidine(34) synthetase TilS n=1 Tax=Enterococcus sp. AZ109 TaxID=2774634 RepID=UPI003F20BB9A
MEQQFLQMNPEIQKVDRVLIAVSTGVDSMVLLQLMEKLCIKLEIQIGVAHVDHQLREESKEEAQFLREYCRVHQLPYYEKVWESPPQIGVEAAARQFRYAFFAELMEQEGWPLLMTAHHGDDQIETMLMRFVRGGTLLGHAGIQKKRPFSSGALLRPLLPFAKETIVDYASENSVTYFEDSSNGTLSYTRNRLRHQVLPVLKEENPRLLEQVHLFHQQLNWAEEGLRQALKENLNNVVSKEQQWTFTRKDLPADKSLRYYFLTFLFEEVRNTVNIEVSQRQLFQLVHLLDHGAAQWSFDLAQDWQFSASYQTYTLGKRSNLVQKDYLLAVGDTVSLSEAEKIRLSVGGKQDDKAEFAVVLPTTVKLPLTIRRRRDGDRIQLTSRLRKKVSRYFIDKKIPQKAREQSWVVTDASGEVLSLLPFVNSYLSISNETDRIHYILDYYLYY